MRPLLQRQVFSSVNEQLPDLPQTGPGPSVQFPRMFVGVVAKGGQAPGLP